jgi:hypothetical protein
MCAILAKKQSDQYFWTASLSWSTSEETDTGNTGADTGKPFVRSIHHAYTHSIDYPNVIAHSNPLADSNSGRLPCPSD